SVAMFLLDHGAKPFYNGEDLIEMSRIRGLTEMEALLESRRSNVRRSVRSASDIWTAAASGNTDRVRQLLDESPSLINEMAADRSGTALVHASGNGHLEVVRLLIARGADPNIPEEGNAPHGRALYAAVYTGQLEIARVLLEHGADPNQELESSADAPSIA